MTARARAVLAVAAVLGVLAVTGGFARALHAGAAPAVVSFDGRTALPLSGTTLTGSPTDLTRLRGSVVLVNFWASWCDPCRQELPYLAAVQRRYAGLGLAVLGVDGRDRTPSARAFLAAHGATALTSLRDPDGRLAVSWGVTGYPETFLVDAAGVVRGRCVGPLTPAWFARYVSPLLEPA